MSAALRDAGIAVFRFVSRRRRFRGMHRAAFRLYDPYDRQNDYRDFVMLSDDGLIQIDTRSFIEWWIYMYGSYEGGATDMLSGLVDLDAVVIDVGANIGTFSLPLARCATSLHAFEPHPRLRARLTENLALNNLRNVVVNDLALSDTTGEAVLFGASHANQAQASLFHRDTAAESFSCPVDTMDNYAQRVGLGRVDLLKVDVEGAEFKVLLGSRDTLERHKPVVYVEVNPAYLAQFGNSPQELGEYLEGLGYELWTNHRIERRVHSSQALDRVDHQWPTGARDYYWLAVHRDSISARAADASRD